MPSILLTAASGAPFPLMSGNTWSGQGANHPLGGVQLVYDKNASGYAYISLSGGTTVNSGGFFLSGRNADGVPIFPGGSYFVPKFACGPSGTLSIYVTCDPAASGQGRLYFEAY